MPFSAHTANPQAKKKFFNTYVFQQPCISTYRTHEVPSVTESITGGPDLVMLFANIAPWVDPWILHPSRSSHGCSGLLKITPFQWETLRQNVLTSVARVPGLSLPRIYFACMGFLSAFPFRGLAVDIPATLDKFKNTNHEVRCIQAALQPFASIIYWNYSKFVSFRPF